MSLTNSPIWFGSGATGGGFYDYEINDSLRFNDNDSAYLSRTPSSATNRTTWTWSAWVKRGNISQSSNMFIAYSGANDFEYIRFDSDDTIRYTFYVSGSQQNLLSTSGKFRDTSSWYHILVQRSGSSSEIYVNGIQQALNIGARVSGNGYFNSTNAHNIGRFTSGSQYFDGYMTEINFIDGQALDPTSFGETKSGVWIPKSYGGSYGTNGFYLDFSDNSTATNLGLDSSGNSNNWSVNNIATTDQMIDTPTNNFSVMNSIEPSSGTSVTLSEGNLKAVGTTVSYSGGITSTFEQSSGKWYWEVYVNSEVTAGTNYYNFVGAATGESNLVHTSTNSQIPSVVAGINGWSWEGDGTINLIGTGTKAVSSVTAPSAGDVLGFAIDLDNGNVYFYHNGTAQNSGSPVITGVSDLLHNPMVGVYNGSTVTFNFGQDSTFAGATTAGGNADGNGVGDFKYSVPSGYLALCTANLPEPVVGPLGNSLSDENFNTVLYSGTGANQSITGVGFEPSLVWIKKRTPNAAAHALWDNVRGTQKWLISDDTYAEITTTDGLSSFDSDGFTLGADATYGSWNNGGTQVAWNWKAGTAFSNSAGTNGATIASSGLVNTDAGFSIVSYVGTGVAGTVYHGLSSTPEFITIKDRDYPTGRPWGSYHFKLNNGVNPEDERIQLNESTAETGDTFIFNSTAPTSNVFSLGTSSWNNTSGNDIIAYCFHSVDGYSKIGQYIGNNSVNGPFVYTGFKPAFIIIKSAVTTGYSWYMMDSTRTAYNGSQAWLSPDQTLQEDTSTGENVDILSNGFKIRTNWTRLNDSGSPRYIYIAFAENPFKYANAR